MPKLRLTRTNSHLQTQHRMHSKSVCKQIMNLGAIKYMTSHRAVFDTHEVISPRNVRLDDDSMAESIGMGPIVLELKREAKQLEFALRMCFMYPSCNPTYSR